MTPSEKVLVEEITRLRAALRSTNDILNDILDEGLPARGSSRADRDYHDRWYEQAHDTVKRSKEVLHDTEEYAGIL